MPLNIDWQQILLHWMNLAILTGGLYVLLYKPVKEFIAKREEHYRQMEGEAADKLAQAEQVRAEYQAKLDGAGEEIRHRGAAGPGPGAGPADRGPRPGGGGAQPGADYERVPAGAEGADRPGRQEAGRPPGGGPL